MGATKSGIVTIMPVVLGVVLFLVIVLFVLMFVVKRQDELEQTLDRTQNEIISARQKRYQLLSQITELFGNGNPDTEFMERLKTAYPLCSSEQQEIEWEEKYVVVMQRFMEYANTHMTVDKKASYEMAVAELEKNESALTMARQEYESAKKGAEAFLTPPLSYVGAVGDKFAQLLRTHHALTTILKEQENEDER